LRALDANFWHASDVHVDVSTGGASDYTKLAGAPTHVALACGTFGLCRSSSAMHGVCTSLYSAAPPTSLAVVGLVCFPTAWYAWPVGWGNMASHSHRALQHRPTLARTCRHGSGLAPRPATCPEEYNIHHPGLLRDSHVATTNRKTRSRCMFASALGSRFNSRHCLSDRNSML